MSLLDDFAKGANAIRALGPTMVRVQMHPDDIEYLRTTIPTRPVEGGWDYLLGVPIEPRWSRGIALVHYSDGSTKEVELRAGAVADRDDGLEKIRAMFTSLGPSE